MIIVLEERGKDEREPDSLVSAEFSATLTWIQTDIHTHTHTLLVHSLAW